MLPKSGVEESKKLEMKSTEYNSGYPDRTMWINLAAKQDALERSAKKQHPR